MQNIYQQAPILYKLAHHVSDFHRIELPKKTKHQAKRVLLDTLGVAIYGAKTSLHKLAVQATIREYAADNCLVWGINDSLCATGAAFFNSLAASTTDFDDGHRVAAGHPASLVVPVALAVGKKTQSTMDEVLLAIVAGYEIGTRFSAARDFSCVETFSSGRWGAFASTTCAAILLKLSAQQIIHALSLSALLCPKMLGGHVDVSSGSMAKEGVAWAAQIGVHTAFLAKNGFFGPYLFLDENKEYNHNILLSKLKKTWHIDGNYFKPYACCRWIHPAIDACLEIKRKYKIQFNQIQNVEIDTFNRILNLAQNRRPINSPQAQFNLPFCVASALFYDNLLPCHVADDVLKNEQILFLASKMIFRANKDFDKMFPENIPCRVTIKTPNRDFKSRIVDRPKWSAENPATDNELYEKFRQLVGNDGRLVWDSIFQEKVKTAEDFEKLIRKL